MSLKQVHYEENNNQKKLICVCGSQLFFEHLDNIHYILFECYKCKKPFAFNNHAKIKSYQGNTLKTS